MTEQQMQLPEGWKLKDLADCTQILDSKRIPLNNKERQSRIDGKSADELYPYLGATGQVGLIDEYIFDGEHLLIGEDGAPFFDKTRNVAFLWSGRFWVNNHAHILKAKPEITSNRYLFYYLNSFNYKGYVGGTTRLKLNQSSLKKIPVFLAPAEQQKQIVAKIEELFSHIDAGIESLKTAKEKLKQYRQSVLKAAVTGELTKDWRKQNSENIEPAVQLLEKIKQAREEWIDIESKKGNSEAKRLMNKIKKNEFKPLNNIPDDWVSVSLLQLCLLVVDCHNKTAPYVDEGIPLIRTSNIKKGKINFLDKMKYVNQETYEYWSRRCPPVPRDILFTREAPMGESAIIPDGKTVCMGQRMMLLRVIHELTDVKYLHIALLEPQFHDRFQDFKVGMGVQHLRVGDVEKSVVGMPSLEEQKEIVRIVEEKLTAADRLMTEIETKLTQAQQQKQTILASAFKGELLNG